MVFCNLKKLEFKKWLKKVTILILIDGFLQLVIADALLDDFMRHNPYFNRWFSAITYGLPFVRNLLSHNPYFNRWFSAM